MAESTLSLSYGQIAARVGHHLGYGRGATSPYTDVAWTSRQQVDIDEIMQSGLRSFYFPPAGQDGSVYDWSFLKPLATLQLAAGAQTIPMPDDFAGLDGQVTLAPALAQVWFPIDIVGEGVIRQAYSAMPSAIGRPCKCALQPIKGTTGTQGQRFQLFFWPQADSSYNVQFTYYLLPDYLTGAFPFPLGGMSLAECLLESCLAKAEQQLDDTMGVHTQAFQQMLEAGMAADRKRKAQKLGYNGDRSDGPIWPNCNPNHWQDQITYNGVYYTD